jgi:hypothetical protein
MHVGVGIGCGFGVGWGFGGANALPVTSFLLLLTSVAALFDSLRLWFLALTHGANSKLLQYIVFAAGTPVGFAELGAGALPCLIWVLTVTHLLFCSILRIIKPIVYESQRSRLLYALGCDFGLQAVAVELVWVSAGVSVLDLEADMSTLRLPFSRYSFSYYFLTFVRHAKPAI